MKIALNEEHEALRAELRDYFSQLVTPEVRAGLSVATSEFKEEGAAMGEFGDATVYKDVIKQIGHDGWLGIGWPEEYGGQNRSMIEQLIFTDEAAIAGVP
ncbi:MAG: acyl-CoA dehydrogenase family protein, partial [Marmoricola sp.]